MSDLPRTASTVIVGGGIVGAATAYFLGDRGETDVVVVERDALGAGSTHGGLGGVRHQFVDELDVRLSIIATAFWRDFDALTGGSHDFRERGYLFLATTAEGLAQLREPLPLYERLGVPVQMLDRVAMRDLVPGLRVDDLAGGRFCAKDGYGDPVSALAGFASAAALEGVRFVEGCAATELLREGGRITGVRTSLGEVSCDRVLVAAGCWSAPLLRTAGVRAPIWPYRRSILESQPIPRLARSPLVVEWESGFHFRPRGALIRFAVPNVRGDGTSEKVPDREPDELAFTPLEVPPTLEPWTMERAAWRHPLLAEARIATSWSCYYEMTPDDHPIVGAVPDVSGLYISAGFSGHGFMHSPATGQLVTELMLDGRTTTLDISDLSLERFVTGRRPFARAVL